MKKKSSFGCENCGAESSQWSGRCAGCGEWNTIVENAPAAKVSGRSGPGAQAVALGEVDTTKTAFKSTGLSELDRVLGGGLTQGSVTLLGGEPGIGKSTLVLQISAALGAAGARCLLVTGEESTQQVAARAARLDSIHPNVSVIAESDVESILAAVDATKAHVVMVDSIQTMAAAGISGATGSVSQVRECANVFTAMAKQKNVAVVLVGHVTKEGTLAGPRVLEHIVDTVLEFEGDRHHGLRFLRAVKHRFGATDEVGVFEMTAKGLSPVADPSGIFLDDRRPGTPGSIVVPTLQGRRPLLVELQALVAASDTPYPRRVAQGLDTARFAVTLAVLDERASVKVAKSDVYVSVVGGVKIDEPGADLALAMAISSSFSGVSLPDDLVAVGEIGLGGEIRKVSHLQKRLSEAARMGFRQALVPEGSPAPAEGLKLIEVPNLRAAIRHFSMGSSPKVISIDSAAHRA